MAGFFYSGQSDEVICFKCNLRLFDWKCDDVPNFEHTKYNPNCCYPGCCKESVQICLTLKNFLNKLDQIQFSRKKMQHELYEKLFHETSKKALLDIYDEVMIRMGGKVLRYVKHNHLIGFCPIANCENHYKSYSMPCSCD